MKLLSLTGTLSYRTYKIQYQKFWIWKKDTRSTLNDEFFRWELPIPITLSSGMNIKSRGEFNQASKKAFFSLSISIILLYFNRLSSGYDWIFVTNLRWVQRVGRRGRLYFYLSDERLLELRWSRVPKPAKCFNSGK